MKLNQFGGGLFEVHSNVGGVCCFESRVAKMGGGSTFFIKFGLIIEYICNFFAFLGWFPKIFFSKFSPAQSIWGGCTLNTCILGGVLIGSAENGGGQHPAPEGRKIGTPPPLLMFLIPSLNIKFFDRFVITNCKELLLTYTILHLLALRQAHKVTFPQSNYLLD